MSKILGAGLFLLLAASGARAEESLTAQAAPVAVVNPILRFSQVSPGIYRGARPGNAGMAALAALQVKTDIDLENDDEAIAAEKTFATKAGIDFISKPMSGFWAPHDHTVNEVIALMADAQNYPIFVHCEHGEDRTGMVIGVYRVAVEDVAPEAAIDEALKHGFHEILLPLSAYFHDKVDSEYSAHHH